MNKHTFVAIMSLSGILAVTTNAQELKNRRIKYDSPDKGTLTPGNLSTGKFYTFSRKPNTSFKDTLSFVYADGAKLTDEILSTDKNTASTNYVGWDGAKNVEVIIDLGRPQLVETVAIHGSAAAQNKGQKPQAIEVFVKEKNAWKSYAKYNQANAALTKQELYDIKLNGKAQWAKQVKIVLKPSQATGSLLLLDEITVLGKIKNTWRYVPTNGAFHGAFPTHVGFTKEELNGRKGMVIDLFEKEVGKPISMVLWYQGMWEGRNFAEIQAYREKFMGENFNGTRFLVVGREPKAKTKEIAEGKLDDYFIQYFKDSVDPAILKGNNDPIWMRPMNEFNGSWVGWSLDPDNFRKAWRRMYNIAEKIGAAAQHIFVWSPNYMSFPNNASNKMELYYPGDQYVDWVGVSSYPPSEKAAAGDVAIRYTFKNIAECYDRYAHYKPFMISEGGFSDDIDRVRWVKEWFELKTTRPNVKAVIWENHNQRVISRSQEALELYRKMVQDKYWLSEN